MQGEVAVITGGSRGIGRAAALAFRDRGAAVVQLDLADRLSEEVPGILQVACDVTSESSVVAAVTSIREALGPVTILHNNAGVLLAEPGPPPHDGPAHQLDLEAWNRTFAVNITGAFLMAKHILPDMLARGHGAIVNTASVGGNSIGTSNLAYASSKAALSGLTRSLAVQYGRLGVRTNSICPGPVRTQMSSMAKAEGADLEQWLNAIPLHRIGEPEEMAEAVVFLASEAASFINGVMLTADGGMVIA